MKLNSIFIIAGHVEKSVEGIDDLPNAAYLVRDASRREGEMDAISRRMLSILHGFKPWVEGSRIERLFELSHPVPPPAVAGVDSIGFDLFRIVWRTEEAGYGDRFRFEFLFETDKADSGRSCFLRKLTGISERHGCDIWSLERMPDQGGTGPIDFFLNYRFFIRRFEAMVGEYKAYVTEVDSMVRQEKKMTDESAPDLLLEWGKRQAAFAAKYGHPHHRMKTVESPGEFRHNGLHYPEWIETVYMGEDEAIDDYLTDGGRLFDLEALLPKDELVSILHLVDEDPGWLRRRVAYGYLQISEAVKSLMSTCVWRLKHPGNDDSGFASLIGDCRYDSRDHAGYTVNRFLCNLLMDPVGPHGRFGPEGSEIVMDQDRLPDERVMRCVRKLKDGILHRLATDEERFWSSNHEVQQIVARMIKSHFHGFYGIGL